MLENSKINSLKVVSEFSFFVGNPDMEQVKNKKY